MKSNYKLCGDYDVNNLADRGRADSTWMNWSSRIYFFFLPIRLEIGKAEAKEGENRVQVK